MATVDITVPDTSAPMSVHRFTSEEYLQMVGAGVLGSGDKVELIGGIIVDMSPAGVPHNHFLIRIIEAFAPLIGSYHVAVQGTLPVTSDDVLDPDFMLLKLREDAYKTRLPQPEDVLLVIEAAESSLHKDQTIKQRLYAQAGIAEYWISDLQQEKLLVHRQPADSKYLSVETFSKDATISPLTAPEFAVNLKQLFD